MKLRVITILVLSISLSLFQAEVIAQGTYQTPPKSIADLVNAPSTPSVRFSKNGDWMLVMERSDSPSIETLSQPELKIAGMRINPATSGPSRQIGVENIKIKKTQTGEEIQITGLPAQPNMGGMSISDDEKYMVFTQSDADGISLWLVDLTTNSAKKLTDKIVNDVYGNSVLWTPGNKLLVKAVNPTRGSIPVRPSAPAGPIIQETTGDAAPSRTYQDLLENPYDEALFAYFMDSQLMEIDLEGNKKPIGPTGMIKSMDLSPDGSYLMVDLIKKPFSYLVPASRFPYDVEIWSKEGKKVKALAQIPLDENRPTGFDATVTGPRNINWRADKAAMLYWVEAQDGGDGRVEMKERDIVYTLAAPFSGSKQKLATSAYRFGGIAWGDDSFAILSERWSSSRKDMRSVINPSNSSQAKQVIIDRSSDDLYNDPGDPVMTENEFGELVLLRKGDLLYMRSPGGSDEGDMPYLSTFNTKTKEETILWRSQAPYYERVAKVLNDDATEFITIKESTDIQPNYWLVNTKKRIAPQQITNFDNPYESIKGIQKQLVTYERNDGLNLSAVIYTPEGFEAGKDAPLPVLMWAYPREYKSKEVASQVRGSQYSFTRVSSGSPLFWVTRGYAVMDRTEMPIVGEGEKEPNDYFLDQLVANAEAAIDEIVELGIGDRNRIAVGGHSYGAFMTANLLSHTDLFAAGIARSGAYNRTLTPFGFQYEQRTYWEAPEVYFNMSPFSFAHKVKTPILLLHGQADNNSGTFPIQSERYYNALKGHGATARLVFLPNESHGYAAKESINHMLWEMDNWLEKYVKNKNEIEVSK
ncbi:dipeptidyl aminopeptidase/acylaminoacyl peptidase [Algoriphagus ratkowskyi]|uniref:Dipeptidyl aminopeptidase/acylaminoacyl peptidase n=1 Tax=Algoriphagus ratkowskyi TaxID=57028 RepID=A0A2W7RF16_9BACT|nr:prolyl oligopeptidase family serine peptidase [Algoriphagus ratkowskyi]PZX57716.1 dipeptidyl aminopeptidase/acylaminoacyl peptidase [Algoriphagus ratkowskyi]TXD78985.1 S9 family peptidase [Algoriphagus ratkowskyi]